MFIVEFFNRKDFKDAGYLGAWEHQGTRIFCEVLTKDRAHKFTSREEADNRAARIAGYTNNWIVRNVP